jgi:hypothetical protein
VSEVESTGRSRRGWPRLPQGASRTPYLPLHLSTPQTPNLPTFLGPSHSPVNTPPPHNYLHRPCALFCKVTVFPTFDVAVSYLHAPAPNCGPGSVPDPLADPRPWLLSETRQSPAVHSAVRATLTTRASFCSTSPLFVSLAHASDPKPRSISSSGCSLSLKNTLSPLVRTLHSAVTHLYCSSPRQTYQVGSAPINCLNNMTNSVESSRPILPNVSPFPLSARVIVLFRILSRFPVAGSQTRSSYQGTADT